MTQKMKLYAGKRRVALLDRTTTIGRDLTCDMRIPLPFISRKHCQVSPGPDGWTVRDLGSRYGTYLNGERIDDTPHLLDRNDTLTVARVRLTVRLASDVT